MEDQARVFYLDYGNTAVIPWTQTRRASDLGIWDLPPMAIPFTLTGKQKTGVGITIRLANSPNASRIQDWRVKMQTHSLVWREIFSPLTDSYIFGQLFSI
jgi:hypothetical protein